MDQQTRQRVQWIAADWGTSNLRVWALEQGAVLAQATSGDGMGSLKPAEFEQALLKLIGDWLPEGRQVPVIACGMVGARQGWQEAPYRAVPCTPVSADGLTLVATHDPRLAVFIAPGLSQANPADVMRGEETQIAGALALYRDFDGVLCLPGTHSKWAQISAGEVISFQSFMTGELFALLSTQSVLRHGLAGQGWDEAAFDQGVADAMARPERLAARLFSLRAEGLLRDLPPAQARARLSGLLIGAEIAAAKPYWLGQNIQMIGEEGLVQRYIRALASMGAEAKALSGQDCSLAGLASLAHQLMATQRGK